MKRIGTVVLALVLLSAVGIAMVNKYWEFRRIEKISYPASTSHFYNPTSPSIEIPREPRNELFVKVSSMSYSYRPEWRPDPTKRCSSSDQITVTVYQCRNSVLSGHRLCLDTIKNEESGINPQQVLLTNIHVQQSSDPHWNDCESTEGIPNMYKNFIWTKGNIVYHVNFGENTAEITEAIIAAN